MPEFDPTIRLEDRHIIQASVNEDQDGDWGLYIIPRGSGEVCISEAELRKVLRNIDCQRGVVY